MVFTPAPGGGSVTELLEAKAALQEEVLVNGAKATLTVSTCALGLADAAARLQPLLAKHAGRYNRSSILLETEAPGGTSVRTYIVSLGAERRTLVFTMVFPAAALRQAGAADWPRVLPHPGGEHVELALNFTGHRLFYATFVSGEDAESLRERYDGRLRAAGWQKLGGERGPRGLYTHPREKLMLNVDMAAEERAGCRGTVVVTRLDANVPEP